MTTAAYFRTHSCITFVDFDIISIVGYQKKYNILSRLFFYPEYKSSSCQIMTFLIVILGYDHRDFERNISTH